MRHVRRETNKIPQPLRGDSTGRIRELKEATAYYKGYSVTSPPKKSFPFKVYKDKSVSEKLNEMFHGKCAYCEALYSQVHPMDVEHYRPKALVIDGSGSRLLGYWWLASDWDNLLPSCIDCNRARSHDHVSGGATATSGKANLFPVDGTSRLKYPETQHGETPLLLNPCKDDPALFLDFAAFLDGKDEVAVVSRRSGLSALDAKRAQTSIDTYGLNRAELVHARNQGALVIRDTIHVIRELILFLDRLNTSPEEEVKALDWTISGSTKAFVLDLIAFNVKRLHAFANPKWPFSQLAVQVIARFRLQLEAGYLQ